MIVQADVQLTPNSLLPSQLFVLGGQSVRGYRQIALFVDAGAVWNVTDKPNNEFLPSQRFLLAAGVGVIWEPVPNLNIRLDHAPLFIDLGDRGNNLQDDGFYFSANYQL